MDLWRSPHPLFCLLILQFVSGMILVSVGIPASGVEEVRMRDSDSTFSGIPEGGKEIVYVNCSNVGDLYEDGSPEHPFDRIVEGIESVSEGGTVLVAAGTYVEETIEIDKGLILRGEGYNSTKILCNCIFFNPFFGTEFHIVIEGFTIQGRSRRHPLISISSSYVVTVTIRNNVIRGGLEGIRASSTINLYVYNNVIFDNLNEEGTDGCGINITDDVAGEIYHNTIVKNYHGIIVENALIHNIRSNIIAFNSGVGICVRLGEYNKPPVILHNDVYGNGVNYGGSAAPGEGDISLDPLFANMTADDYYLSESSPCIDAGINVYSYESYYGPLIHKKAPAYDIAGNSRPFDGDRDGNWTVDIGAFEFWGPRSEHDLAVMAIKLPSLILPGARLIPIIIRNLGFREEVNVKVTLLVNGAAVDSTVIPRIAGLKRLELSFRLKFPETPCLYNITVYVQEVDDEDYIYNNYGYKVVRVSRRCSPIIIFPGQVFAEDGVVKGSGTIEDPYVIEGWEIDVSEASVKPAKKSICKDWKIGILIASHTEDIVASNIIIRNVSIYASNESGHLPYNVGIVLVGVERCRIENANLSRLTYGIVSYGGSHIQIVDSRVSNCCYNGIGILWDCTHYIITNSTITNCNRGIKIIDAYEFQISSNNVSKNRMGIIIEDSNSVKIENNTFSGNDYGVHVQGDHIQIIGNDVWTNRVGLKILSGSSHIKVYLNNFVENRIHVEVERKIRRVYFDFEGKGNYWSGYQGVDIDGDGIGETIYPIWSIKDTCPLVTPYSPSKPIHPKRLSPVWYLWATVGLGTTIASLAFLIYKTRIYRMPAFYALALLNDIVLIESFIVYLISFLTRVILRDLLGVAVRAVLVFFMVYLMKKRITSEFALRKIEAYLVSLSYGLLRFPFPVYLGFLRSHWLIMDSIGFMFSIFSILILGFSYTMKPPPSSVGET